jgi:hypothetical protein
MVTPIKIRYATDEDYAKRDFYTISAVRRADPNHKPKEESKDNTNEKPATDKKSDTPVKSKKRKTT